MADGICQSEIQKRGLNFGATYSVAPIPTHYVLQNYENHIPLLLVIVTVTLDVTSG